MGDTRTDSGQYYPGGRVVARHDVAPPQISVKWSDIQGKPQIAPLPDRYREDDMKGKINEIASKFATVLIAALAVWTACADITVQKKRKDQIWNDEQVVVDVTESGSGVDTNAVRDIVLEQLSTNGIRSVDGAARPLPKYLHLLDFDDSYPDAAWYYAQPQDYGSCSAVRDGGFLYRNYDWKFDDAAEFVVRMTAGPGRFASVGVANVGTNITEEMATSGKQLPPRYYKALPGRVVDGINENGVVAEVNVVDGDPHEYGWPTNGTIHCLGAVRWVLDNATNAASAALTLAAEVYFPSGWTQNFHYMIADETATYIVENGAAHLVDAESSPRAALTNFRLYPMRDTSGEGQERYDALMDGANITNAWWTLTYTAAGYRASDLPGITGEALTQLFDYWASKPRESHRGESFHSSTSTLDFSLTWWQTVHTSVYDITNKTLRICVQETDNWYTFALPSAGTDEAKVREIAEGVVAPVASAVESHATQLSHLSQTKADEFTPWERNGVVLVPQPVWMDFDQESQWNWTSPQGDFYIQDISHAGTAEQRRIATSAELFCYEDRFTATRKRVLRTGDAATPQELAAKRDLTDNVCMEESFVSWSLSDVSPGVSVQGQPYTYEDEFGGKHWVCAVIYDGYSDDAEAYGAGSGDLYATHLNFCNSDADIVGVKYTFTATRQRVATPYELFVTQSYVTNSIATLAPAPGNYAAVSNAAMNAIQAVTNADANLIFTITSDGAEPRFYFAPVGAIDPED